MHCWSTGLRGIFALALLLGLSACSAITFPEPQSIKPLHIIFVPGFKGSVLRDSNTNEVVWLTASEALVGDESLALSQSGLEVSAERQLAPDGVLKSIRVLPGIYALDVYGDFLDWLKKQFPAASVEALSYDWRESIASGAAALSKRVELARGKGAERLVLVSHSMGSLVTAYYLRYGGSPLEQAVENWAGYKRVDAVVVAGAPFKGVLSIFHDLQRGIRTGLNTSLLSAKALQTFQSSFELLPAYPDAVLETSTLLPVPGAARDAALWSDCKYGLFAEKTSAELREKRRAFVGEAVSRGLKLNQLLNQQGAKFETLTRPLLAITGIGQQTHSRSLWDGPPCGSFRFLRQELNGTGTNQELLFADGDSLVTRDSQALPPSYRQAFEVRDLEVEGVHARLLNTAAAKSAIAELINSLRKF